MVAMPERKRSRLLAGTFFFSIFFLLATSPAFSAETYRFERMWPSTPSSWFFRQPAYVATDSRGYIYVSDSMQIQKFTADGQLISKWLLAYSGGLGAITVAEDGSVFVAASQNGGEKILKLDASGNIIRSFGQYTTTVATAFKYPCGLAVDREGNVYAADSGNHRVQKFSPDGILITEWGTPGSGNGQFNEPAGIAVDRKNNFVYVMDTQNLRTQKFTTDGQYLTQWQSIDSGGRDPAMGISVDPQGTVIRVPNWTTTAMGSATSRRTAIWPGITALERGSCSQGTIL